MRMERKNIPDRGKNMGQGSGLKLCGVPEEQKEHYRGSSEVVGWATVLVSLGLKGFFPGHGTLHVKMGNTLANQDGWWMGRPNSKPWEEWCWAELEGWAGTLLELLWVPVSRAPLPNPSGPQESKDMLFCCRVTGTQPSGFQNYLLASLTVLEVDVTQLVVLTQG